ncbi:hypothetical protein C460_07990 [Haloferax sp. ATCC BAA-646]|nr:hypothetical protein C460_07990 [Haloferax sp. ATCC BAA-646]ELZ60342.1 hypothetical protein C459_16531 [Haloferax sp. ATCC BAA-645]
MSSIGINPILIGEFSLEESLQNTSPLVQYLLVFIFAATPALELWAVIPVGIALGMNPLGVATFGFLGNIIPVYLIIIFFTRIKSWLQVRGYIGKKPAQSRKRSYRFFKKYGVPGFAVGAPFLVGVHVAAFLVLTMGAKKRGALLWMTVSIAFWTIVLTTASSALYVKGALI